VATAITRLVDSAAYKFAGEDYSLRKERRRVMVISPLSVAMKSPRSNFIAKDPGTLLSHMKAARGFGAALQNSSSSLC
jgi:hypothetical protein